MKNCVEIRWHGRGGQGAKTAALLLADVAFKTGSYVQGFPEYGPERMGAPITAYNRISPNEIRVHSNIYDPDFVVVVDESLLDTINVTEGLNPDGAILINTAKSKEDIEKHLNGYKGKVFTIHARFRLPALENTFRTHRCLQALLGFRVLCSGTTSLLKWRLPSSINFLPSLRLLRAI